LGLAGCHRPLRETHGIVDIKRLGQIIEGPTLKRPDGTLQIGVGRNDNDRQIRISLL
jgi:hypothetical protein